MIINLTPHAIRVRLGPSNEPTPQEGDIVLPPSGSVARCQTTTEVVERREIATAISVPVFATTFGTVDGLPRRRDGVTLVVSTPVAQAAKRADVVSPLTDTTAIRKDGQVYAVRGFQTFARR